MSHERATYPDTADLLRHALVRSWRRDRYTRALKLGWRWGIWLLTRYGSSFIAAALVAASSPDAWINPAASPQPVDSLILKPSLQLNPTSIRP
jgi:hypothetical protein